MNTFTFLLCVLMHEVKSQIKDVYPARILVPQKIVSENSNLHVMCSTFGFKKNSAVHLYLCNNGTGVEKLSQKPEENDSTFTLKKVTPNISGDYSCVFSTSEYEPHEVHATGNNIIGIRVLANFQPADLMLNSPSSVSLGAKVEFVCSLPNVLKTLDDCGSVQSYLMRDRVIYQVQGFDVQQRETRFVIEDAVQKDSGLYSCVVRPSQCFKDAERITGNNAVNLQVQKGFPLALTVFFIVMSVTLFLAICLCAVWRTGIKCDLYSISCMTHSQVNNSNDSQRSSDAQDSFADDNSGYENVGANEPYSFPLDTGPVYDEVLSPAGSSYENQGEPQYATCNKTYH